MLVHPLDPLSALFSSCETEADQDGEIVTYEIALVAPAWPARAASSHRRAIFILRDGHIHQPREVMRVMADFEREVLGVLESGLEVGERWRRVGRDVLRCQAHERAKRTEDEDLRRNVSLA